ncbi:MAG: PilZ domain-containing protein [Myxococcota bacterium]
MAPPPDWTVDTSDLATHMFCAAASTDRVTVTCAHGEFVGTLLHIGPEEIRIATDYPLPELSVRSPLCVEYETPADGCRFYTEVRSLDGNQLSAALPYALERRRFERHNVPPGTGLGFRPDGPDPRPLFPLQDISTAGISFVERGDAGLTTGCVVRGEIVLPGEAPMRVSLEVRHLQLRRGQLHVGARIRAISLPNQARLAWFLLQWKTRAAA